MSLYFALFLRLSKPFSIKTNCMIYRKLIFITIFNSFIFNIIAQNRKGVSIEVNSHFGKIIKHTPKLLFTSPRLSTGIEIHLNRQLYGQEEWHQWQRYPSVGASFFYFNLGNKDVFGTAVGVCPTLNLKFLNSKILRGYLQIGSGIAFLTKHYDFLTNPTNTAVGSKLNDITHIKIELEKSLSPNWKVQGGLSFTHFSNGSSQTPNYGINIPAANLGLIYCPNPVDSSDYIRHNLSSKPNKKLGMSVHTELAFTETSIAGGPRYPVYIASVAGVYHINKVNRLMIGLEYEQNKNIYAFALQSTHAMTRDEAFRQASRYSVYFADEFVYGRVSILLQLGVYIAKNKSLFIPDSWYDKLGLRWYFPPIGRPATQFYAGIYLKSHRISAEYLAIGGGATF